MRSIRTRQFHSFSFKFIFYLLSKCEQVPQRFRLNFMCSKNGKCGKSFTFFPLFFFCCRVFSIILFLSLVHNPKIVCGSRFDRQSKPKFCQVGIRMCNKLQFTQMRNFNYFVNTCDYRVVSSFGRKLVRARRTFANANQICWFWW